MRIFSIFCIAFLAIFLNGCFLTSLFNFGPKIDLAKSGSWRIASFTLDGISYKSENFDETPHIRFDVKELRLNGNTGCNMFFATYAWLDDKNIEVRNSGMTRKMCHPENVMKFEQKLMEEFEGDFEVVEEDKQITLKRENLQIVLIPINPSDEVDKETKQDAQTNQETNQENASTQINEQNNNSDEVQVETTTDSQSSPHDDSDDIEPQSSIGKSYQSNSLALNVLPRLNLSSLTTFKS